MADAVTAAALVDQWTPLALRQSHRWAQRHPHLAAEFESLAGEVIWQSALAWTPEICAFSTFFVHRFKWRVLAMLARERRQPRTLSIVSGEDREDGPADPIAEKAAPVQVDLLEVADSVAAARRVCNPLDWRLLERVAVEGVGYEAIATELKVSKARIGQRVHRAIMRARAAVGEGQG